MKYNMLQGIMSIILGIIFLGFAVYFCLCSLVIHQTAEYWKHFMWGAGVILELLIASTHIFDGIKNIIRSKK